MSTNWRALGGSIGAGVAAGLRALVPNIGEKMREHYATKYGRCRRCEAPLGGPSPERVCEDCHADEALGAMADGEARDA